MSIRIFEISGKVKKITIIRSRYTIDNLSILRAIKDCTGYPPISLRNYSLLDDLDSNKELVRNWAIYFCYQYANNTYNTLEKYFNLDQNKVESILRDFKLSEISLEFEEIDGVLKRQIELVTAYDIEKNKILTHNDWNKIEKEHNCSEKLHDKKYFNPDFLAGDKGRNSLTICQPMF